MLLTQRKQSNAVLTYENGFQTNRINDQQIIGYDRDIFISAIRIFHIACEYKLERLLSVSRLFHARMEIFIATQQKN